jgi:hypothetical protein
MTHARERPPPAGGGPPKSSSYPGIDLQVSIPNRGPGQAEFSGAHVVQYPARIRPPRPRRIDVQITARDGRAPIGRSRPIHIDERDVPELIDFALRLEARA